MFHVFFLGKVFLGGWLRGGVGWEGGGLLMGSDQKALKNWI